MNVTEAVLARHSTRAFLNKPVDPALVRDLLDTARYAPSGGNLQPWQLYVLTEAAKDGLIAAVKERMKITPMGAPGDYPIYPFELTDPWKARRSECGEDMYKTINVPREDKRARLAHFARNYEGFGAPVLIFMSLHKMMGKPQWSDAGMFLQTLMLLAEEAGLATCPQEAWSMWTPEVRVACGIPDTHDFFCGLALGYKDEAHPINSLRTSRAPLDEVCTFKS